MVDKLLTSETVQVRDQKVLLILGSKSDLPHAQKITEVLDKFSINYEGFVNSAHRDLPRLLTTLDLHFKDYDPNKNEVVILTIAGLGDALSGDVKGYIRYNNLPVDVAACPPPNQEVGNQNYWTNLLMPDGMSLPVFLRPKNGAYFAIEQFLKNNPGLASEYAEAKDIDRVSEDATYTFGSTPKIG